MDREKAVQAAKWLNAIDGFEDFVSAIEHTFHEYNDGLDMTGYQKPLFALLNRELAARRQVLEDL